MKSPNEIARAVLARFTTVASMSAGKWYSQKLTGMTLYFLAEKEQKNGGWSGIEVRADHRKDPKAKKSSVPKMGLQLWKPATDVPDDVKDAVK